MRHKDHRLHSLDEGKIKGSAMSSTIKVFISSTFRDLFKIREDIISLLRRDENIITINMENWGSSADHPKKFCLDKVCECQIYVGLFGKCYGFVPDDENESMTILEYREARRSGLIILSYIIDWTEEDPDEGKRGRQYIFRSDDIKKNHTVAAGLNERNLVGIVLSDIKREVDKLLKTPTQSKPVISIIEDKDLLTHLHLLNEQANSIRERLEDFIVHHLNAIPPADKDAVFKFEENLSSLDSELNEIQLKLKFKNILTESDSKIIRELDNKFGEARRRFRHLVMQFFKPIFSTPSLPSPPTICVGREFLVKMIWTRFRQNSTIFLHGMVGIGKTTVLRQFIAEYKSNFDGCCYISVPELHTEKISTVQTEKDHGQEVLGRNLMQELLERLSAYLFDQFEDFELERIRRDTNLPISEIIRAAVESIRTHKILWVIDGFEQVLRSNSQFRDQRVEWLLEELISRPDLPSRILIAGRYKPQFNTTIYYESIAIWGLGTESATKLLGELAAERLPTDFERDDRLAIILKEKIGGHPQALQLIASYLSYYSFDDLLNLLPKELWTFQDELSKLIFDKVHDKLEILERKLIGRLSVFRVPVTIDAIPIHKFEKAIQGLHRKLLMIVETDENTYSLHGLIRSCALKKLSNEEMLEYQKGAVEYFEKLTRKHNSYLNEVEIYYEQLYHRDVARMPGIITAINLVDRLQELAVEAWKKKQYLECEKYERLILDIEPTNVRANFHFALCLQKRHARASRIRQYFEKAISHSPSHPHNLLALAEFESDEGNTKLAEQYYQKALAVSPKDRKTLHSYGLFQEKRGNIGKALELFQRGLEVAPKDAFLYLECGRLEERREKIDKAIEYFQKGLEAKPGDSYIYLAWSRLEEKRKNLYMALDLVTEGLKFSPHDSFLHDSKKRLQSIIGV